MFLADYHCHSNHSVDGRDSIDALLESARDRGLREIAVTDHVDMCRFFDHERHREAVRAAREQNRTGVRLLCAAELGEATHDLPRAERALTREPYDFILGSYHSLKGGEDPYEVRYRSPGQCYAMLDAYMDELLELVCWGGFDVLGHLTYPLRYMCGRDGMVLGFRERYETRLRALFAGMTARGIGLELNTSGLYKPGEGGFTLPTPDILALYRDCGGEIVTIGSDAHRAAQIGFGIEQGLDMVRAAGFAYIARFQDRRPFYEKI